VIDWDEEVPATLGEIRGVFAEWDRRWREEPETFMNEVEHLLRSNPESYGENCAPYFKVLLNQLREAQNG